MIVGIKQSIFLPSPILDVNISMSIDRLERVQDILSIVFEEEEEKKVTATFSPCVCRVQIEWLILGTNTHFRFNHQCKFMS